MTKNCYVQYETDGKTSIFDIPFHFNNVQDIEFRVTRIPYHIGNGILIIRKKDYVIDVENKKIVFYKTLKKKQILTIRRKEHHHRRLHPYYIL